MKKFQIQLEDIKVKSFVTDIKGEGRDIKGGLEDYTYVQRCSHKCTAGPECEPTGLIFC